MQLRDFDITIFDLKNEWGYQDCYYKVTLHSDSLEMHCKYVCNTWIDNDDEALGVKEQITDQKTRLKRNRFISIEKCWSTFSNCWIIEIEVEGYPLPIKYFFKDENQKECDRIYEIIEDWIFEN